MKSFNIAGCCFPEKHYMVPIADKLAQIKEMVDAGNYFVINRGRQYGKTTTLSLLEEYLREDYLVLSLDFQALEESDFSDAPSFCCAFAQQVWTSAQNPASETPALHADLLLPLWEASRKGQLQTLSQMFELFGRLCSAAPKPIVLMIDEVDAASDHPVFLEFLAKLRSFYLRRQKFPTFHSVILAGVYDIKNLRLKIRQEATHSYNSPWNIAVPFDVDMSLSPDGIVQMLSEYEADHHTGMDIREVADWISSYTSGYPVLVSTICARIHRKHLPWNREGVEQAVKLILSERDVPLFGSLVRQLDLYPELRTKLEAIIFQGAQLIFSPYEKGINMGLMFGYIKQADGKILIANRIFELCLLELFLSEASSQNSTFQAGERRRNQFTAGGRLDMELLLQKFMEHYTEVYAENDQPFWEQHARKLFLLYLKPIINGTGHYYLEAETRDALRTDIVIDYLGEQFVVELKIWHGEAYNAHGEEQLSTYLDRYHLKKGYLLTFSFAKHKKAEIKTVVYKDKLLVEAIV